MKYIDADRLRAEIERRHIYQKEMYNKTKPDDRPNDGWAESLAIMGELEELRTFIDSLQQEQDILVINKKDWEVQEQFRKNKNFGKPLQQKQPSLPDNLDEAAEEWCKRNNKGIALCGDKKSHYLTEGVDAFKAGAEWMAGQGVQDSIEGTVCGRVYDHINIRYTDDIGKTLEPRNISHIPVDVNKYKIGDKVIVQIRKKDE